MSDGRWWSSRLALPVAWVTAVLGLVTVAPAATVAAEAATTCPCRSSFGNEFSCKVPVERVLASTDAVGRRVYLLDAFVTEVAPSTITVAQTRCSSSCNPSQEKPYCGPGMVMTFVYLKVAWSGSHRPAYGTQLRLYGTTDRGSLAPTGYVGTGY